MNSYSPGRDVGWLAAYDRGMRYAQRGGYTPAEQQRRERLRLQAAERFARGDTTSQVARDLRVTEGSVRRWRRSWRDGGTEALKSRGPASRERLTPQQFARLVRIVKRKLKKIQYRPHLIDGCLAGTGLTIEAW